MKSQLFQGSIVVKKSPIEGYGVFAEQNFKPGDLIEECRVLLSEFKNSYQNHVFFTNEKDRVAMPLGYGAIYNHAEQPNAKYSYKPEIEVLVFTALRHITKGEEILISYGKSWFENRMLEVRYPFRYWLRRFFSRKIFRMVLVSAFIFCLVILVRHPAG